MHWICGQHHPLPAAKFNIRVSPYIPCWRRDPAVL